MADKMNISAGNTKIIVYLALIVVTLAAYWQVNHYDFVNIDDPYFVTLNSHIKSGLTPDAVRRAFSMTFDDYWMPLSRLSYLIDYRLYGLRAGGYHFHNLILHILSTLLLFWLFNRMTGEIWPSAFVAALFALHPLHVESVAWVAERKGILNAFFWIMTLCLYVRYTEKPHAGRYLLVLFSFILAMMSKPMVVTLPFIMMLLDCWPLKRYQTKQGNFLLWQLKEKAPFFVLSVIFSVITIFFTHNRQSAEYLPPTERIANAAVSYVAYLEKTLWPRDMAVFYPFPAHIPAWQFIGASLLIVFISATIIINMKRFPYLFTGWFWYLIVLAPVIGIFQISVTAPFAMTDRYHYLPSIGIGIGLAWGIPALYRNGSAYRRILFPAGTAFLILMTALTWQQCRYWKNSTTLFSHALQATRNNALAHNNLAYALLAEGKPKEAIVHYSEALRIIPGNVLAYINRGNAYAAIGQTGRAMADYNEAIRLKPDCVPAYYNRGNLYNNLGQDKTALENFNKAISLLPDFAIAYISRGILYLNQGKNSMGCLDAQRACELGSCKLLDAVKRRGFCR
jgi:tetratricopeptide (TPR) repeat protein